MTQFLTSLFAKTIMHATYFKTANQQHQQNPVNELNCTNLYALICFLRTNICGSFFMVHGVQKRFDSQGAIHNQSINRFYSGNDSNEAHKKHTQVVDRT